MFVAPGAIRAAMAKIEEEGVPPSLRNDELPGHRLGVDIAAEEVRPGRRRRRERVRRGRPHIAPIPAVVKGLGPGIGYLVLSVNLLGNAFCIREEETPAERFDVVKVEELLKQQYEQRWVPGDRGTG